MQIGCERDQFCCYLPSSMFTDTNGVKFKFWLSEGAYPATMRERCGDRLPEFSDEARGFQL